MTVKLCGRCHKIFESEKMLVCRPCHKIMGAYVAVGRSLLKRGRIPKMDGGARGR